MQSFYFKVAGSSSDVCDGVDHVHLSLSFLPLLPSDPISKWRVEPNNLGGNEHCAVLMPEGRWDDRECEDQVNYACRLVLSNCECPVSIYLVLFVLQVAHKASTRARQRCRSAETRSRRPHVQPFSFISLSTVLLQVSLGRPLFLWPSGVHRRAILVKAVVCWRSTCPIHRQRLRLTWVEMGSISALRCSSSLVMVFGQ